jgi:hypothetical protein
MLRVSDLPEWPSDSSGSYSPGRDTFATGAEEPAIKDVVQVAVDTVTFRCMFRGQLLTYELPSPDARTAQEVASILRENVGKALLSIAMIEIPADKS